LKEDWNEGGKGGGVGVERGGGEERQKTRMEYLKEGGVGEAEKHNSSNNLGNWRQNSGLKF
jgi:hypothetical protein